MARVLGTSKVMALLRDREQKARRGVGVNVEVGYAAPYAIFVHERTDLHHPVGQAKYLEQPTRQYAPDIARITREGVQKGRTLKEALTEAGNFLLEASRPLVPIETGQLRASGYVRVQ